ncbi:MAG: translation elongation factor Ts [Chloroflexi bacterium RBG_13_66_10]|jgi:elongation factor Ts|nr:MAG: translation elongation factor Ts [Chloroflexi bacterium RBG_13_66_10]
MSTTAEQIKELRQATGAGILECRDALESSGGDLEKATALLREKGLATAAKRADRETREGVLDLYSHGEGRVGVMVEVNCETDFVGRTAEFRNFAHEVALQVAANSPRWLDVADIPPDSVEEERQESRRQAVADGKPEAVIERIVEGRLEKFYQDNCLLRQPYIRDDSKTVADLLNETIAATGERVTIRRFVRWTVGQEAE